MCGIAGLVRFAGLRPDEAGVGGVMAATLRHRGPDEMGVHADTHASLGHARLSIIDLAAGRQPMSNEDGTIQVVCNGEIYNHRELAERQRDRGTPCAPAATPRCSFICTRTTASLLSNTSTACSRSPSGILVCGAWCWLAIVSASSRSTGMTTDGELYSARN